MALMGTWSGTICPTRQFSQYRPPISSADATTPDQTEVAAPCGIVFNLKGDAFPYSEQVYPWIKEELVKADEKRRDGEDAFVWCRASSACC